MIQLAARALVVRLRGCEFSTCLKFSLEWTVFLHNQPIPSKYISENFTLQSERGVTSVNEHRYFIIICLLLLPIFICSRACIKSLAGTDQGAKDAFAPGSIFIEAHLRSAEPYCAADPMPNSPRVSASNLFSSAPAGKPPPRTTAAANAANAFLPTPGVIPDYK